MSTFATIKTNISGNLNDAALVNFAQQDIDDATQDAYDEVVALSQCIIKKINLNFQNNLNYYNFQDSTNWPNIYVSDFMACTAIFSNQTNLWLLDDKVIKDFDRERLDWENWIGNAVWWAPCNDAKRIVIVPKQLTASGSFDLYYWAQAPTIVNTNSPLVPPDFENLIEIYATASLLESYEEFSKAQLYFNEFYGVTDGTQNFDKGIFALALRSKNLSKSDLLMYA
jgi:hypothetical protein